MAYVVIQTPTAAPIKVMLKSPMVLGRAMGCELWIDDARISRRHCQIEEQDDEWIVEDLGSTHGTYLNGRKIDKRHLEEGDALEVGGAKLIFHEGKFVENRPADPVEAATMGTFSLKRDAPQEGTTLNGFKMPEARFVTPPAPVQDKMPVLAFSRPPAQPIVPENIGPITRLFRAVFSGFRRR
jgi:predicted component of type VI protein secretion system